MNVQKTTEENFEITAENMWRYWTSNASDMHHAAAAFFGISIFLRCVEDECADNARFLSDILRIKARTEEQ